LVDCGDVRFGVAADGQAEPAHTLARDVANGVEKVHVRRDVVWVGSEGLAGFELEDVVGEEIGAGFGADVVVEVAQELERTSKGIRPSFACFLPEVWNCCVAALYVIEMGFG
jgi:hypothetical protein